MKPKELLQMQFDGGVLMLMDGLVANLVPDFMTQQEAEKAVVNMLKVVGKVYENA